MKKNFLLSLKFIAVLRLCMTAALREYMTAPNLQNIRNDITSFTHAGKAILLSCLLAQFCNTNMKGILM